MAARSLNRVLIRLGASAERIVLLLILAGQTGLPTTAEPSIHRHERAGDVRVALVAPIFDKSNHPSVSECTNYSVRTAGVQVIVEPFMYVLRDRYQFKLGNETDNITVGFYVGDSCSSALHTAAFALETGLYASSTKAAAAIRPTCNSNRTQMTMFSIRQTLVKGSSSSGHSSPPLEDKVVAVVGPSKSNLIMDFSPLFNALNLPHVTPGAQDASNEEFCSQLDSRINLSDHEKKVLSDCVYHHGYSLRTVPSNSQEYLIEAILDTMKDRSWWHVVLLADGSRQGTSLFSTFQQKVFKIDKEAGHKDKKICVAFKAIIPIDTDHRSDLDFIVEGLKRNNQSLVVVLFADHAPAHRLFTRIASKGEKIPRVWLGTTWAQYPDIFGNESYRNATLMDIVMVFPTISLPFWKKMRTTVEAFTNQMNRKTVKEVREDVGNPWLCLYWDMFLNCSGSCGSRFPRLTAAEPPTHGTCNDNWTLPQKFPKDSLLFSVVPHVIFATEIVMQALSDVWQNVSSDKTLSKGQMKAKFLEEAKGNNLLVNYLLHVKLPCKMSDIENSTSYCPVFRPSGKSSADMDRVPPSYALVMIAQNPNTSEYYKFQVGSWIKENTSQAGVLLITETDIWGGLLSSDCRQPCGVGEVAPYASDGCCWKCTSCLGRNITNDQERTCEPCIRQMANSNHTECVALPVRVAPGYYSGLIITVFLICVINSCVLITLIASLRKRHSLAVKSSDSLLSLIMLVGIFFGMLSVLSLHLPAESGPCWAGRLFVLPWLLLTATTTLVRTSRIARLWTHTNMGSLARNIWTLSTRAQLVLIAVLIVIGIGVDTALIFSYGSEKEQFYEADFSYSLCKQQPYHLVVDMYIAIMLLVTCACAFLIRKMPGVWNESRHLFLASFCVCMTWALLTPLAEFSTNYRPAVLSMRVAGQMASLWCWLFLPRLYILKKSNQRLLRICSNQAAIYSIRGGSIGTAFLSEGLQARHSIASLRAGSKHL